MKNFFYFLLLLIVTGCASLSQPRSPKVGEIISSHDIRFELFRLMEDEAKLVVMDARFVSIPEDRTRKLIEEALFRFDTHYVVEARDCDDIAIEYIVRLRALFRRELNNTEAAAPVGLIGGALVGDIPELKISLHGNIVYHAMVVVRCSGGKWLLVEPSLKRIVDLSSPYYEGSIQLFLGVF